MTLEELRRAKKDEILKLAGSYGAHNIRVFGSTARGDSSPESDIDFLVELEPNRTLMDLGGLLMDLQGIVDARVDVATESMLRPGIREKALRDAVPL